MKTNKQTTRFGLFYKVYGRWAPYRTIYGNPVWFKTASAAKRLLNNRDFLYQKNRVLKSKVTVRKFSK